MVTKKLPDNIIEIAKSFRNLLEIKGIQIVSIIIFGSQAKGTARPESDIDVCVISPSFGLNDVAEMQMLFKQARHVDSRIEPYPMSPKAFEDTNNPIVGEIHTWGVVI